MTTTGNIGKSNVCWRDYAAREHRYKIPQYWIVVFRSVAESAGFLKNICVSLGRASMPEVKNRG